MYDYSNECAQELGYTSYGQYLASSHWRKARKRKLQAAQGKCERCGSEECLQIHHKSYDNLGCEHEEELQVLCRRCHDYIHLGPFYIDDW